MSDMTIPADDARDALAEACEAERPIVQNPEAIGDPNQTPVVQLTPELTALFERTRCPECRQINQTHASDCIIGGRILGSDAARAVDRFRPEGPSGYRAKSLPDGPLRATRAEAEADERAHLDRQAMGGAAYRALTWAERTRVGLIADTFHTSLADAMARAEAARKAKS